MANVKLVTFSAAQVALFKGISLFRQTGDMKAAEHRYTPPRILDDFNKSNFSILCCKTVYFML